MSPLQHKTEAAAANIETNDQWLTVELRDGRTLTIPLAWYPRLLHGTAVEQANWQLLGDGYAIEWPDLDEHIGISGLLAGNRSGESAASLAKWRTSREGYK